MKVYVITETTEASRMHEFTLSMVRFAFTSKKKANEQLDIIARKVENGGWWSEADGTPLYGNVIALAEEIVLGNYQRDLLVESPNGLKILWRVNAIEANEGFGFNL